MKILKSLNRFKVSTKLNGGRIDGDILSLQFSCGEIWKIHCKQPLTVLSLISKGVDEGKENIIDLDVLCNRMDSVDEAAKLIQKGLKKVDELPKDKVGKVDIDEKTLPKIEKPKKKAKARKSVKKED